MPARNEPQVKHCAFSEGTIHGINFHRRGAFMRRILTAAMVVAVAVAQSCAFKSRSAPRSSPTAGDDSSPEPNSVVADQAGKSDTTKTFDFKDDTIEGGLQKPDGEHIDRRSLMKHSTLLPEGPFPRHS